MKPAHQFVGNRTQLELKAKAGNGSLSSKSFVSKASPSSSASGSGSARSGNAVRGQPSFRGAGGGLANSFLRSRCDELMIVARSNPGGGARVGEDLKAIRNAPRQKYNNAQQSGINVTQAEATTLELTVDSMVSAFSEQRLSELPEDIDAKDGTNFVMASEYVSDIMDYMFQHEKKFPVNGTFLDGRQINGKMRGVLMDWLVEVHYQYKFNAESLYLCNKIMDRFLSVDKQITRSDLQLVGVTSLFLATKFEEVYVPPIREFVVVSDNAFTVAQVRAMECRILRALKYDLSFPQPCFFLRRFSKAAHADIKIHTLAKYIMELSIIDFAVVDLMPSAIAAASLALSLLILNKSGSLASVWTRTLEHYSTYTVESLRPFARQMAEVLARYVAMENVNKLKAIKIKYSKAKTYCRISRLEELNLDNWKERIFSDLQN